MDIRLSKTTADLASNSQWPTFQAPDHLEVYDIRTASQDVQLSVTTMTGVINRQQPKIYLLSSDDAAFWLNQSLAQVPHDISNVVGNAVLDAMLKNYGSYIRGLIIYDPNYIESINIATLLAGQRDSIVVSPVLAKALQGSPHELPVVSDLRIYQWNNRIQAYSWAERNLLKSASPNLIAGLDPKISGALRSFLVSTRTFIYWLDARKTFPDILHGWISESGLMQRIFSTYPSGAFHLGWFVDEPHGVSLTSKAAMPVLASDFFENLEVWTSVQNVQAIQPAQTVFVAEAQGEARVPDNARNVALGLVPVPTFQMERVRTAVGSADVPSASVPKAYVSLTISDGDNLQYDQHRMARLWGDPVRGSLPIGWTISPSLVQVAPSLAAYYMNTASANDELLAGPSGSGYMFPSDWPGAQLPGFLKQTGELMQAMKLSVIEILDTSSSMAFADENLQKVYVNGLVPFGLKGILSGSGQTQSSWKNVSGVPVLQNLGLANTVAQTVTLVKNASTRYLNVYIMAWSMTPSDLKQAVQQLGNQYEIVKPSELLKMIT
jgi:GxGYxYP putative glycoside hydrolase C-terminal domain/GxGYxY sequence motif in domain of unknown function N-terminal